MNFLIHFAILIIFFTSSLFALEPKKIHFAPLPMKSKKKIEEFLPLVDFLETNLSLKVEINYQENYDDIIKGFMDGTIDIAYLGPLPYAILKSKYPHVKPIVTFKEEDGNTSYRCTLSKFAKDTLDFSEPIKVALTQALSTCGYYSAEQLLQKNFGLSLQKQKYKYEMSHSKALLGVLKEEFLIASTSEKIAKRYETLGMQIIATSEPFPAFALVVNTKTLSNELITQISQALLKAPDETYESWSEALKYGVTPADVKLYEALKIRYKIPEKGNML
jgi:phosphonate transport system substrate-binding protein